MGEYILETYVMRITQTSVQKNVRASGFRMQATYQTKTVRTVTTHTDKIRISCCVKIRDARR